MQHIYYNYNDDNVTINIKNFFSFNKLKINKIGVAVSGGVDSMVLLHSLININYKIIEVIHCNFNLRKPDSDKDELFIKKFCEKNNIKCHIKNFDTISYKNKNNRSSIQMITRKLRYDWFNKLLKNNVYDFIALGHHFNDSIETFLINLFRGTGIKGLLGIPNKRRKFIRPLFNLKKKDIILYAKNNKIKWIIDKSNKYDYYLRNKIRMKLCSPISRFFPNFYNGIKKSMNIVYKENILINKNIENVCCKITIHKKDDPFIWKINNEKIKKLDPLSLYLFRIFHKYGFCDINSLKSILYSNTGKYLFSKKYCILKNRNDLIITKKKYFFENKNKIFHIYNVNNINISIPIKISSYIISKKEFDYNYKKYYNDNIFLINFEKIQFPLLLRIWINGDFFYPFGMNKKKKLSKYYKDSKFSILDKQQTWLLVNNNNDIILIIKHCLDDRYKIDEKTEKILIVKC